MVENDVLAGTSADVVPRIADCVLSVRVRAFEGSASKETLTAFTELAPKYRDVIPTAILTLLQHNVLFVTTDCSAFA